MKKKAKGKIRFRRFFLIWFMICFLAGCARVGYFYKQCWRDCLTSAPHDDLDQGRIENIEYKLKQADETGDYPIQVRLAGLSRLANDYEESAWVLYQPETGEFYTDQPCYMTFVWQNGERNIYFLYDTEMISRLHDSVHFLYGGSPLLYSIYVKDDQFVPGELFVVKDSYFPLPRNQTEGRKIAGEWVDLTPENTDGWTKIECYLGRDYLASYHDNPDTDTSPGAKERSMDGKQYFSGWCMQIGCADAPEADAYRQMIQSGFADEYASTLEAQKQQYADAETGEISEETLTAHHAADRAELLEIYQRNDRAELLGLPKERYLYYKSYMTTGRSYNFAWSDTTVHFRGGDWLLCHFQYLNPKKMFDQMYLVYLPLFIPYIIGIGLLAALILSVITYLIYSRRYDIEAYRRNLTGALAHDLKTPLAVIYGNAENLRAHVHPENADEYAECIMENVRHVDEMIAGVLGLAQLERKTAPPMKESVDLTALLHTAFQRNAAAMAERGLTLEESGKLVIRGNAEMLTQLAENLAANAVQHTAEGGKITVTVDEKNTLRISNPYTGELDEKQICEPFRRGDAARGSQSGSGLGLSIVQQIASLHKCRLRVTARNGEFTVALKKRKRIRN